MNMQRLCALIEARNILEDALREVHQHEGDKEESRNCGTWTNEDYDMLDYVCGACVLEAALRYNMRQRAEAQGVTVSAIMVQDLGAILPRPARSAA